MLQPDNKPERYYYGFDQECAEKLQQKFTPELEMEVMGWIMAVLGNDYKLGTMVDLLRDGTVLCDLVNKISPGCVPKVHRATKMAYKHMENIGQFLDAAERTGTRRVELFQTVDLYEEKDLLQVLLGLLAYARTTYQQGHTVPFIGPRHASPSPQPF